MASERTPEEQDYFDLLSRYREESKEDEEAEARFQEDLEQALALSLSEETTSPSVDPSSTTQPAVTGQVQDKGTNKREESDVSHPNGILKMANVNARSTRRSRQNRRFVSDQSDAEGTSTNTNMSSGGDNSNSSNHPSGRPRSVEIAEEMRERMLQEASQFHPSGRRRSIEMAEEMRRQMKGTEESNGVSESHHPSGRRRSVEIAEEMQRQMLQGEQGDNSDQYHPSGRRRSIEIAEEMQRRMMLENQNDSQDDQYHPSGRRRSIELADAARQQMLTRNASSATSLSEDEEVSREVEELIRRGLLPTDNPNRVRQNRGADSDLFGDGDLPATDRRVKPRGSQARIPQHHSIDFKNPFKFGRNGFPVNWDKTHIPPYESDDLFNLVEIISGEEEYETIARDFHIAELEVKKIERLQNLHLLDKYKGERDQLLKRRGKDYDVNARYLYHGSTAEKLILCEEGLDARLSVSGCFGRGIYFSDNPKKCLQYVSRSTVPYILMCRVMLGDTKIYPNGQMDRSLKREPEKENPVGVSKFYDSVRGKPIDFNEYVVYENRRAMIEYIITFHRQGQPLEDQDASQVGGAVAANVIEEESIEDHMMRIQQVREEIRQTRASERGEEYSGPTPEQRKKDRDVWRRVLKVTCPPGTPGYENVKGIYEYLDKEEKDDTGISVTNFTKAMSQTKDEGNKNNNNNDDEDLDLATARSLVEAEGDDSVQLVMHHLVADFMQVTATDNVQMAKMYLERAAMNLDQAILLYYEEEAS